MYTSDDEADDYLSEKFLVDVDTTPTTQPATYSQRRKRAQRESQLRNDQHRLKPRRERELEAREEGLSKSLFQRAKEEASAGRENKAMSMMMKMGFQPGMSLGVSSPAPNSASAPDRPVEAVEEVPPSSSTHAAHRVEPLPLNEWMGKKGIGLGLKRPLSPTVIDELAKKARREEEEGRDDFRERARHEFEMRRAEGRALSAVRTCRTFDEKEGIEFNYLWLNPNEPELFPEGLLDVLDLAHVARLTSVASGGDRRRQLGTLQPLSDPGDLLDSTPLVERFSPETVQQATRFLSLNSQQRLDEILAYLRAKYHYCFWCGSQYATEKEIADQCPGSDEDSHD